MTHTLAHKSDITLLVGAGPTTGWLLKHAADHASAIVAADGGYTAAIHAGLNVELTVGDMDSISKSVDAHNKLEIKDQSSTDFEKCLQVCDAQVFLGLGFLGGRLDHQMAAFSAILKDLRPVVLMDSQQLIFIVPKEFKLKVDEGAEVAFYPLVPVQVEALGLEWPLQDVEMEPGGLISTSNKIKGSELKLKVNRHGLLAILPMRYVGAVLQELRIRCLTD